jgi:hypothetical protein
MGYVENTIHIFGHNPPWLLHMTTVSSIYNNNPRYIQQQQCDRNNQSSWCGKDRWLCCGNTASAETPYWFPVIHDYKEYHKAKFSRNSRKLCLSSIPTAVYTLPGQSWLISSLWAKQWFLLHDEHITGTTSRFLQPFFAHCRTLGNRRYGRHGYNGLEQPAFYKKPFPALGAKLRSFRAVVNWVSNTLNKTRSVEQQCVREVIVRLSSIRSCLHRLMHSSL